MEQKRAAGFKSPANMMIQIIVWIWSGCKWAHTQSLQGTMGLPKLLASLPDKTVGRGGGGGGTQVASNVSTLKIRT